MSATTCDDGRLVALPLRDGAERDDDLAEDVELHRRRLVVAGELELGVQERDWPKLFVPESSVEPIPIPSSFPRAARLRLALLDRVVADQVERDVEAARVVAGVVDAAVRRLVRHLLGLDVVALPDLDRVEARARRRRCR